jgi:D-alanine-D-alanine ligase
MNFDPDRGLLKLTDSQKERLELLFLALHAPEPGAPEPGMHPVYGVFPRYNYELFQVLTGLGLRCTPCRELGEFVLRAPHHNYVFTLLNRAPFRNSEVFVSSACEWLGVPYLGAPPNIRALAEDKHLTKLMARALRIPTPPWIICAARDPLPAAPGFAGPWFIKQRFGAASVDVSPDCIQETEAGLHARLRTFQEEGKDCLIEAFIPGVDITVPVLGGAEPIILGVAQEISALPQGIVTHRQKRLLDGGRERLLLPSGELSEQLQSYTRRLCEGVKEFDYLRVDFRLHRDTGQPFLLEFNIGCNLGSHAAIMFTARHAGLQQPELIEHILRHSLDRQRRQWESVTRGGSRRPLPPTERHSAGG